MGKFNHYGFQFKSEQCGFAQSAYCLEPLGAKGARKSCSVNQNTFREVWADLEYG